MGKVMLQFRHAGGPPTLGSVRERFGLLADEVDADYGIVLVDPADQLYVVLVEEDARERVESALPEDERDAGAGVYGDPRVEGFGPPET